ncbi:hypothetical protein PaecuDRAFT_4756 [Paenibacillus curdlanolyticus YK9]|uniref:YmcC n=1 Tax=Paenibacillus curdlanolyticus YK9 TaxID=717606 RepID=E0IGG3_9BACL|nr:hypothetical protein [Paenibacillus curdlanolyticus]EFM08463.1 hypothetical protein PaecuDRAFT_4756 [Paenibacillus curdlanolyticus YK9]
MITAFIIGCEIGFWALVLAGLACRYLLRLKTLGAVLLIGTPIVDLILIIATVMDLRNGATATAIHGLSAIYIGVSVAYGHRMICWADARFAHRFAGGAKPSPKPKHGAEHAAYERRMWVLHLLAWAIGCLVLVGMIWFVGDESRTNSLRDTIQFWSYIVGIDFLYSFSFSLWPRKAKA